MSVIICGAIRDGIGEATCGGFNGAMGASYPSPYLMSHHGI